MSQPAQMVLRTASWCALAWAAAAGLGSLLTLADISGLPLLELITSADFLRTLLAVDQSRALLLVVALAALVHLCARRVSTAEGPLPVLVLAAATLVPPILTGHASSHSKVELATVSVIVHVVAASVWVGGLGAVLLFRRDSTAKDAATVARFSALALVCFLATGPLGSSTRGSGSPTATACSASCSAVVTACCCSARSPPWLHWLGSVGGTAEARSDSSPPGDRVRSDGSPAARSSS